MAVSKTSNKVAQDVLSSKFDRTSIGERRLNCKAWTSILKLLATMLIDIGITRFIGHVSTDSSK